MRTFASITDNELEGIIFMIPTEYSGRKSAAASGYRGQFFWHINGVRATDWDVESYFENDLIEPGQSAKIKIKLSGSLVELGRKTGMPIGRQFGLREGSKIVAVGVLTESVYEDVSN